MKINALTGSRAIAALMIIVLHYGCDVFPFSLWPKLFGNGNLAVSYFFVLSGFVLFISQRKIRYFTFLKNRFARIAPAYLAALAFMSLFLYYCHLADPDLNLQVLYSALFIQSYLPHYVLELNSPSWSVSVEMTFYIQFPLLLYLTHYRKFFLLLTAVVFAVSQAIHLYYFKGISPLSGSGIYFNPFIHMNEFLIGMAGGIWYTTKPTVFRNRFFPPLFFALSLILILIRPGNISYDVGLIAPVFMLLIISIAENGVRWLSGGVLVFLGEISYGIYIYQLPVYDYLQWINSTYLHIVSRPIVFYGSLAVLLGVATFSYYCIEQPVIHLLKTKRSQPVGLPLESNTD